MRAQIFAWALVVGLTASASAQSTTTLNPTVAVFTASADHNATLSGSAVVTNYLLEIYDGSTVVRSTDLGKPTPVASGDITVPLVVGSLAKNKVYTFQIVTVGPGGSTRSAAPSNPFAFAGAAAPATNLRAQ